MSSIEAQKQRLFELVADFEAAMLVIDQPAGPPLVRPVRVIDFTADGQAVLATWNVPELSALGRGEQVLLLFQGRNRNRFAWIRGPATVERGRDAVDRRWGEVLRDWFPSGPENSTVCLVVVSGAEGEYWDRRQPGGLAEVLECARTLIVGGHAPEPSPPHAKVKLACRAGAPPRRRGGRRAHRAVDATVDQASTEQAFGELKRQGVGEFDKAIATEEYRDVRAFRTR